MTTEMIGAHVRVRVIVGLALGLLYVIWIAYYRNSLLADPDTAWHIIAGRDMWRSFSFPLVDAYSHTFTGKPWIAKEWLSQLFLFGGYAAAGWQGVAALAIASTWAFVILIYYLAARHLKPPVAVVLALLAWTASCSTFLARPHIFALPLTLIWTWYLFEKARLKQAPHMLMLGLLVLWANLHSSFTFGWIIAGFAFLSFLEEARLRDKTALVRWMIFLLLCPLVCLIHPYGYKAALMTLAVTAGNEATSFLVEWAPFSAAVDVPNLIILLVMVAMALASGFRVSWSKTAFALTLLYLFLAHSRFAYLFFAILPVIIAPDIAKQFSALSFDTWRKQSLDKLESRMASNFSTARTALSGLTAAIVAITTFILPIEREPSIAAEKAMAFITAQKLQGNVLNAYGLGGTLIFNGIPTYIDGRSDQLFQQGFFTADMRSAQPGGKAGLAAIITRYNIQWTILRPTDPRVAMLDAEPNWKRLYGDDYAIIHQRNH